MTKPAVIEFVRPLLSLYRRHCRNVEGDADDGGDVEGGPRRLGQAGRPQQDGIPDVVGQRKGVAGHEAGPVAISNQAPGGQQRGHHFLDEERQLLRSAPATALDQGRGRTSAPGDRLVISAATPPAAATDSRLELVTLLTVAQPGRSMRRRWPSGQFV